jgi:biotin synthase
VSASIRYDWSSAEILEIHNLPLLELIARAEAVHRAHQNPCDIQRASLLSIKTGACPENCTYCPQSAHWQKKTGLQRENLLSVNDVLIAAREAKTHGAQRFCMGAAWREVKDGPQFDSVLEMVRGVRALGMEACVTLGMLNEDQARRLADAGLTAYNHNIDTSPEFYPQIITTRTFQERLDTLDAVQEAGIEVCCGGIIGMGESVEDRAAMLQVLSNRNPHPQSVPINALVSVPGTPLENREPIDALEFVRLCATARIIMPKARVRLSAGRRNLSREAQILCFLVGANSIFYGEKLLTTSNNDAMDDDKLLNLLGARQAPFASAAE